MINEDLIVYSLPDHCSRCEQPFALGSPRYMVRMTVVVYVLGDPESGNCIPITNREYVSVCEGCLDTLEKGWPWKAERCGGCDALIQVSSEASLRYLPGSNITRRLPRACSRRCDQRIRRARQRAYRPTRTCRMCSTPLPASVRRDASYCSPACRQRAWRQASA